jgi:hypothetical protein
MQAETQVVLKWNKPKAVKFPGEVFSPNDPFTQIGFLAEIEE